MNLVIFGICILVTSTLSYELFEKTILIEENIVPQPSFDGNTLTSLKSNHTNEQTSSEISPLLAQTLVSLEGRESRLNKQERVPVAIFADKMLRTLIKEKGSEAGTTEYYRTHEDPLSSTVVQNGYYGDSSYRVFGSEISFTNVGDKQVYIDGLLVVSEPVDLNIIISEEKAKAIAESLGCYPSSNPYLEAIVELVVLPSCFSNQGLVPFDSFDGKGTLTYEIECPDNNIYFISAQTGENMFSYKYETSAAFATTYYNGNVSINTLAYDGAYYLEDMNRTSTTVDCNYGNCSTILKITDPNNYWTEDNLKIANQIQWGVGQVLDYFRHVQGRNGLDGSGGPSSILSEDGTTYLLANKIHYGTNENYAAWTGSDFVFGDGDGLQYGPMVSLDIVAHEMAHAIIEYECNLNYFGESGALTESFGDITAAVISYWTFGENNGTWMFGEDDYTPGIPGDALRYLNEPHLAANKNFTANDDPDYFGDMYNGTLDNGGVHVNAGISNKAFYLLSKGGNHSHGGVTMTGIGIDAAYAIWYRAVTTYFISTTNFAGARTATLYACADLYGEGWMYEEVQTAWGLCGVGSVPNPTPSNLIINGGFEGSQSPWALSGSGALWVRSGSGKKAGLGYLELGISNSASGQASQSFSIPINTVLANFSFWIWTTTSDSNTVIHDRLWVELHNSTNGALITQMAAYSNCDATAAYIQRSFDMMPYENTGSLSLVFRATNDGNAPTTFRIDEVYLEYVSYK
jgi:Zn-dependent metalloprotease